MLEDTFLLNAAHMKFSQPLVRQGANPFSKFLNKSIVLSSDVPKTAKWVKNSVDPDQTLLNAESD